MVINCYTAGGVTPLSESDEQNKKDRQREKKKKKRKKQAAKRAEEAKKTAENAALKATITAEEDKHRRQMEELQEQAQIAQEIADMSRRMGLREEALMSRIAALNCSSTKIALQAITMAYETGQPAQDIVKILNDTGTVPRTKAAAEESSKMETVEYKDKKAKHKAKKKAAKKRKKERERAAKAAAEEKAAAEAKAQTVKKQSFRRCCGFCQTDLTAIPKWNVFTQGEKEFCRQECLRGYRRKMQATAAAARAGGQSQ